MKKKLFLLLTPLLLLSSCGSNYSAEEQRAVYDDLLTKLTEHSYTQYDVEGKGHVLNFTTNDERAVKTDQNLPAATADNSSLFMRIPMRLTADTDNANKMYTKFRSALLGSIDSMAKLYIESTDEYFIHVTVPRVQRKNIRFYNVDAGQLQVTMRFSINLCYNNYGLLVKEEIKSINSVSNDYDRTVDLVANYSYK